MIQRRLHLGQAFFRLADPLAARGIHRNLLRMDPWIKGQVGSMSSTRWARARS
jgi:hypothetical protein